MHGRETAVRQAADLRNGAMCYEAASPSSLTWQAAMQPAGARCQLCGGSCASLALPMRSERY